MTEDSSLLYSMQLSWYSAKVRPYLRFKGIPFSERTPTAWEYYVVIPRHCGHAVVPIVMHLWQSFTTKTDSGSRQDWPYDAERFHSRPRACVAGD